MTDRFVATSAAPGADVDGLGGGTSPEAVSYHPATAGAWTARSPSGGGVASVSGGELVLVQPAAPVVGDPYRASLLRTLDPDVAEDEDFEIILRIASFALDGGTLFTVHISARADGGTAGRGLRVRVNQSGGVGIGYLQNGTSWRDAGAAGTVAINGTGWLRVRVRERRRWADVSTGAGASQPTSWTRRVIASWDQDFSGGSWGTTAPPEPWAYWGFALTAYGSTAGTGAHIDHASIRRLLP